MNENGTGVNFERLEGIMEKLRAPGGCPWDREQTFESLRTYIIEEAYELVDAISRSDMADIREECGDLLLQVVFVSCIAAESDAFSVEDVIDTISEKLIRRHPHVFGETKVADSEEVLRNWERIKVKEKEKARKDISILAGVPGGLPSLIKAYRIQEKTANVGFDWPKGEPGPVFDKIKEETQEVKDAIEVGDRANITEEIGDLLFAVVNLARRLDVDPEIALEQANSKFSDRFRFIENNVNQGKRSWEDYSLGELDDLWNRAKKFSEER